MNKNKWKPTTIRQRELAVKNYMKRLLGHFKIQKLDRLTYQRAFIDALKKDLSASTVKLYHSIFKIAINAAIDEDILSKNRFTKIVIKDENYEDLKNTTNNFITVSELNSLLSVAKKYENTTNQNILLLVSYTGIRRGECIALQWKDVDFKNNTISISKTRDQYGTRPPKTKNSYRTIRVESFVMQELEKYKNWCKKTLLQYGKKLNNGDFIFINEYGEPIDGTKVNTMFNNSLLKAGILDNTGNAKITFHGLRHTHATILLNAGVNPKVIAERLGNTPAMMKFMDM